MICITCANFFVSCLCAVSSTISYFCSYNAFKFTKFNLEEKETLVDNTPTYMRKQMKSNDEINDTPEPITIDSSDDMLMFSDDLEVPAFIRNRNL